MSHVKKSGRGPKNNTREIDADTITMPEYNAMLHFVEYDVLDDFHMLGIGKLGEAPYAHILATGLEKPLGQAIGKALSRKEVPHHPDTYTDLAFNLRQNWPSVKEFLQRAQVKPSDEQFRILEENYDAVSARLIKLGKDKGRGIQHQPAAMGLQ